MAMRMPLYGTPNYQQLEPMRSQQDARGFTLPAPIGGWNARDPLAAMKPSDAVYLNNFYPMPSQVLVRPGCVKWAQTPARFVKSLIGHASLSGATKLFAATDIGVYDVSSSGVNPTSVSYALTSGNVISVNFVNGGSTFSWCCNGVDNPFYYSTLGGWQAAAITGLDATTIKHVSAYQSRLMLIPRNSMSFWYLGLNAIQGAATEFPMGSFFSRGGYLVASDTWTYTTIMGVQKYFCLITSQGEVAVYSGLDPSLASTWSLVGIYFVGKPVGSSPFVRMGTELCVMTVNGLVPMTKAVQAATTDRSIFYTDKIQPVFSYYVQGMGGNSGWGSVLYPSQTALLINVPLTDPSNPTPVSNQLVMNTQTGAWTMFTGWNASCFCELDGKLFFASTTGVYQAWTGTTDAGNVITAQAKTAFTTANTMNLKHVSLVRPIFTSNMVTSFKLGIDMDFDDSDFSADVLQDGVKGSLWDQATWDQATWADSNTTTKEWQTVPNGNGVYFALRLQILASGGTFAWSATNYLLQTGGALG